jgi:hypothetical protein
MRFPCRFMSLFLGFKSRMKYPWYVFVRLVADKKSHNNAERVFVKYEATDSLRLSKEDRNFRESGSEEPREHPERPVTETAEYPE